jgi:prepilin-type N-terminal cleavage/methylation domain-containing protein
MASPEVSMKFDEGWLQKPMRRIIGANDGVRSNGDVFAVVVKGAQKEDCSMKSAKLRKSYGRGVTLIEVMIVVVILGMIAGGVAVAVFPKLKKAERRGDVAKRARERSVPDTPGLDERPRHRFGLEDHRRVGGSFHHHVPRRRNDRHEPRSGQEGEHGRRHSRSCTSGCAKVAAKSVVPSVAAVWPLLVALHRCNEDAPWSFARRA